MTRYLHTSEAAAELGIHPETLRRWVRAGIVTPTWRTPRRGDARWDVDDLHRQLHPHSPAATQEAAPVTQPAAEPQAADRPERPSVMVAVVTSVDGVLVGKRNDGRPPWTFIAGENELHETPTDTIVREVKEETGLLIKAGATIGERVHPRTSRHMVYVAARPSGRDRRVWVGDPDELAEVRWVTLHELYGLMPDLFPPVRAHLERVLRDRRQRGQAPRRATGQEALPTA